MTSRWMITNAVAMATLFALGVPGVGAQSDDEAAVDKVLDSLHQAASDAHFDRYFELYSHDFIFLGTDATERWDRAQFMAYARGRFLQGRGWTYTMIERHVYIAPGGQTAWFDERLDNANLGETRGSGALVKEGGEWKIAQYNLSIPVPNQLVSEFVAQIRAHE